MRQQICLRVLSSCFEFYVEQAVHRAGIKRLTFFHFLTFNNSWVGFAECCGSLSDCTGKRCSVNFTTCEQKVSLYSSSRTSPTNATDPVRPETMHTYPSHCFTDDDISVWVSDRSCSKLTPVLSLASSVQSLLLFSLIMERIPQSSTSAIIYVHKCLFKLLTLTMFLFSPTPKVSANSLIDGLRMTHSTKSSFDHMFTQRQLPINATFISTLSN